MQIWLLPIWKFLPSLFTHRISLPELNHTNMSRATVFFIVLALWISFSLPAFAQDGQFGVNATLTLPRANSPFLNDYSHPASGTFLLLRLTDQDVTALDVRLHFRLILVGQDIPLIETRSDFSNEVISLLQSVPQLVTATDLQNVLATQNLAYPGFFGAYSREDFLRTGQLPEGRYRFELYAVDANRTDRRVSNIASAFITTTLSDPPQWTQPRADQVVSASDPQNVVFQWSPNNGLGAAPTAETSYTFRIWELADPNLEPNWITQSLAPLEEITTRQSQLVLNQTNTPLIPGQRYAIQVQARMTNERALFRNEGRSEVRTFQFGHACTEASQFVATTNTPFRASLAWQSGEANDNFTLKFREAGSRGTWHEQSSRQATLELDQLKAATEYEYQVFPACGTLRAPASEVLTFNTPSQPKSSVPLACGNQWAPDTITNQEPMAQARFGDQWTIGGFDLFVNQLEGQNGTFSGEGEIQVPWLFTTVAVVFQNLKVNALGQVYDGVVYAQSEGFESLDPETRRKALASINPPTTPDFCVDEGGSGGSFFGASDSVVALPLDGPVEIPITQYTDSTTTIQIDGVEQTISVGETVTLPPGTKVTIPGPNGDQTYVVGPGGATITPSLTPPTGSPGTPNALPTLLARRLDELLRQALIDLVPPKLADLPSHTTEVERLTVEITKLQNQSRKFQYSRDQVSVDVLGVGLSERLTVRTTERALLGQDDHSVWYQKMQLAYLEDRTLLRKTRYTNEGLLYLEADGADWRLVQQDTMALGQLKEIIKTKLGIRYSTEALDSLSRNENINGLRSVLTGMVDTLLSEAAETAHVQALGYNPDAPEENMLWASTANYHLAQYAFVGNYALDNQWDPAPPVLLTPMERAALLKALVQQNPSGKIALELDPLALTTLPLALSQNVGGQEYLIAIEQMIFTPQGAEMSAFMALDVPFAERQIAFGGDRIGFSPGGLTGASENQLALLMDIPVRLSNEVRFWVRGETGETFVRFDCSGFKGFSLKTSFEFCDQLIVKEDLLGNPIPDEYVNADLLVEARGWDQFMGAVNIDRFQAVDLEGWSFEVTNAWVDMSDLANPAGMIFPEAYTDLDLMTINPNLWRGFYLQEATVWLPEEFSKNQGSDSRISISAQNLLIDQQGFSGVLAADNLLTLDEGNAGGWGFSVEHVEVAFEANVIVGGTMLGQVALPISEQEPLKYAGFIESGGNYGLTVQLQGQNAQDGLDVPMFGLAHLELLPGSSVGLVSRKDPASGVRQFMGQADLSGILRMKTGSGGNSADLPSLRFEKLRLNHNQRRFQLGGISLGNDGESGQFGGFPVSLNHIRILNPATDTSQIGLQFELDVRLQKAENQGFSGQGHMTVWADQWVGEDQKQHYRFDRLQMGAIRVAVAMDPIKIDGQFHFFNDDPMYGNGFQGGIIGGINKWSMEVNVLFGNTGNFRYWYVDGAAAFPTAIQLGNTGLELNGFSGGAYRHMKQAGFQPPVTHDSDAANPKSVSIIGMTRSGIRYLPDPETALGLKAGVQFSNSGPDIFKGDATFEMAFNRHGGINRIQFRGNVEIAPPTDMLGDLTALTEMAESVGATGSAINRAPTGNIRGSAILDYDFINAVFNGSLTVHVNVMNVIYGDAGPDDLAGWSHLYFSENTWYLHAGTPTQPMRLTMLGAVTAEAYLMVGHGLPDPQAPPPEVMSTLNVTDVAANRNPFALSSGSGMAFGASLALTTGNLSFAMFYAHFSAGVGFDVMMTRYPGATCVGLPGLVGINGWYANGQAYAYLQGKIGVRVDLPIVKGNYDILDIAAAALMEAELPNPTWLRGTVGGHYSLLNGLVTGECRFQVEVGDRCDMVGGDAPTSALSGVGVIAQVTPAQDSKDVDVFTNPQAIFNLPIDQTFQFRDEQGTNNTYRVHLESLTLQHEGKDIPHMLVWNDDHTVVALEPQELLPGQAALTLSTTVAFQQLESGQWVDVKENGETLQETASSTFTSGGRPEVLREDNIRYAYPLRDMVNFYPEESNRGFIQLRLPQDYLFDHDPAWKQIAYFEAASGATAWTEATWNQNKHRVEFDIPAGLVPDASYTLQLLDVPQTSPLLVDANVDSETAALTPTVVNGDTSTVNINTQTAVGNLEQLETQVLYTLDMRTSLYTSLAAKVQARTVVGNYVFRTGYGGTTYPLQRVQMPEYFESREVLGNAAFNPLVVYQADLADEWHYQKEIKPWVYENYPNFGYLITNRVVANYGAPPVRHVYFRGATLMSSQQTGRAATGYTLDLIYGLPITYHRDFANLKAKVVSDQIAKKPLSARARKILEAWRLNNIPNTPFPVQIRYRLPDGTWGNSNTQIILQRGGGS